MSVADTIAAKFGNLGMNVSGLGAMGIPVGYGALRDGMMATIRGQQFPISKKMSMAPEFMSDVMARALYGGEDENNSVGIEAVNPEPTPLLLAKWRENYQDTYDNGTMLFNTALPVTSSKAWSCLSIPIVNSWQLQRAQLDANALDLSLSDAAITTLKEVTVTNATSFTTKYRFVGAMIDEAGVNTSGIERLVSIVPPGIGFSDVHNIWADNPAIEDQAYAVVKGGPLTLGGPGGEGIHLKNVVRLYCGSSKQLPLHCSGEDGEPKELDDKDYVDAEERIRTYYQPVGWDDATSSPKWAERNRYEGQEMVGNMPQLMWEAYHLGRVIQMGIFKRQTADSATTSQMRAAAHTSIDAYRQLPLTPIIPLNRTF